MSGKYQSKTEQAEGKRITPPQPGWRASGSKTMRSASWLFRPGTGLCAFWLVLILSVCTVLPGTVHAAITSINAWSNIYSNTAYPGTVSYAAGAGSNRMLVVAVISSTTTAATQTCSVTYGGQAMTQVRADGGTTQAHTYLFYLNEAGLQAASGTNLVFSFNLTAATNDVFAAVYGGVDQSSSISNSTGNTGTTSVDLTTSLTIGTGEQGVETVNMSRTGGTTYRTISTPDTGWTASAGPNQVNNGTVYTSGYVLSDSTAGNAYYSGNDPGKNRTGVGAGSTAAKVNLNPAFKFPLESPYHRFFIVDEAVTYYCDTIAKTLTRYAGYTITNPQPTSTSDLGDGSLMADKVSACSFTYDSGASRRSGMVTLDLTIEEEGEKVHLLQQIHVSNAP